MDNSQLQKAVRAELSRISGAGEIESESADGIVVLSGVVADPQKAREVEQRLLALPEVMDVHNYLRVAAPSDGFEARLRALLEREGVADAGLEIRYADGVVTLSGEAEGWFDRDAMGRLAWTLAGVREVDNRVTLPAGAVEPGMDDTGQPAP
jgi:osmotically-inducible protein OsmY